MLAPLYPGRKTGPHAEGRHPARRALKLGGFPPKIIASCIWQPTKMLAFVCTAASGVPRAQSVSRATLDPDSGTVCISTAVHTKTAQCNLDCNARGRQCPKECLCAPAKASLELSFGMPSDSFASLVSLAAHGVVSTYNASAHKTAALHRKAPEGEQHRKAPEGHHHVAYNAGQMAVSNARARRRCL